MSMRKGKFLLLISLFLLITAASGCTRAERAPDDALRPPPEPPVAGTEEETSVAVYYLKSKAEEMYLVREVHNVPHTREVARAALKELIEGTPKTEGAFRVLPEDTRILGITIEDGLATVDFSREVLRANVGAAGETLGIQSIVNTLTEFHNVKEVVFKVEGGLDEEAKQWWGHVGLYEQPFTRHLFKVYEPAIWVYKPAPDQRVTSPLLITGNARVFEGTVNARLVGRDNRVLARGFGTALNAAPERGDFEITLRFDRPRVERGWVEVFWESPEDGKELDKVCIPVSF